MNRKPYSKYKPSGVEWLGEIPEEWKTRRLKYLSSVNDDVLGENTEPDFEISYVDIGSVDSVSGIQEKESMQFENAPSRARRKVRNGDVIVSTVRTYLRAITPIVDPEHNLIVSTGFAVIRPKSEINSSFAAYALRAPYFVDSVVARSVGVSYPAINASDLVDLRVAVPPYSEQGSITTFLNRETARIDELIAKKVRQIELLQEKRTALVSHTVTKGLDPNVKMKPSGVEWLGEIPKHWDALRIKSITAEHKQGFYTEQSYTEAGAKLVRITDIDDYANVCFDNMPYVPINDKLESEFQIREGDFLFARSGTIGRFGVVKKPERAVFASYLIRFRFKKVEPEYLKYAFKSKYFTESLISSLHGGANQNIHAENIKECWIAVPSHSEQVSIVDFLNREILRIDALIEKINQSIGTFREYRTAVISAAVTGKIDVREEALS